MTGNTKGLGIGQLQDPVKTAPENNPAPKQRSGNCPRSDPGVLN
jgi:hypothetical protein